jgi:iron complex outermembrane recepter protein
MCFINKPLLALATTFLLCCSVVLAQQAPIVKVTGRVIDSHRQAPLNGASIIVKDKLINEKPVGVSANIKGEFTLFVSSSLPLTLLVSYIGYETANVIISDPETLNLTIPMISEAKFADEVIVIGQRITVEELKSPITKDKITILDLQQAPSFNVYDAISNMRGVDMATQSLLINSVNTRGFNATTNLRFSQFVDGIDNQAPGLNFPLSNIAGISDLDLESIELVPGPSTGIMGSGAFNGTLVLTSKDPFDYPGLSLYSKFGVNGLNSEGGQNFLDFGGNPVADYGFRFAKVHGNKLGWKLSGSYLKAIDFKAEDYENIGPGYRFETHINNPGISAVNIYGDEILARMPLGSNDSIVTVTRTGYKEEDLVNYNIRNLKLNGSVHYKLTDKTTIVLYGNYGIASTMFSGDNRIYLKDFSIFQYKAEVNGERFSLRSYATRQNSGNSYDAGLLATRMLRAAKPDDVWFNHFRIAYNGFSPARAFNNYLRSREFADSGFGIGQSYEAYYTPGTTRFDQLKLEMVNKRDGTGAGIYDRSGLYHVEGRYIVRPFEEEGKLKLETGLNVRLYDPESNGTIFPDTLGNDITILEGGGFARGTLPMKKNIVLTGILRVDKNENFKPVFNPSIMMVKTLREIHNVRASIQSGFRYPGVREQFINQDLGEIVLVGGLPSLINHYQLEGNAFTLQTRDAFNRAVERDIDYDPVKNPQRYSRQQAEIKNAPLLEVNIVDGRYSGIRPERVSSFEIGYRSLFEGRRLIDISYYRSHFSDFIGIVRFVKPSTSPQVDLMAAASQMNNSSQSQLIYMFANSTESVVTQGLEATYDVTSLEDFIFVLNFTWAHLNKASDDPIIPAFNTPKFKYNLSIGHRRLGPNFGFKLTWRLRDKFYWESPFADGEVQSINTVDLQFNLTVPKIHTQIKFGGSNLFNDRVPNVYGGPGVSSLFYVNLTYDPFFFRSK